jgi:hypothetical protein
LVGVMCWWSIENPVSAHACYPWFYLPHSISGPDSLRGEYHDVE